MPGGSHIVIDTAPPGYRQPMGGMTVGSPFPGDRQSAATVAQAGEQGAEFIVIDTPSHADSAARVVVEIADLVLIPYRPSAFDLSAIQTTVKLVQLLRKPAFAVFTAGSPNAPRQYQEAGELAESFGTSDCPFQIPDRGAFWHASAEGRTVMEFEPTGKTANDVRHIYLSTCRHVGLSTELIEPARNAKNVA